jgi:hypothetical protein
MSFFPADQIVYEATEKIYQNEPSLLERFGEKGKEKCREDNHHHLKHLQTAFDLQNAQVFTDYAIWLNGILIKHGMKTQHLIDNFDYLEEVLIEMEIQDQERVSAYLAYLKAGTDALMKEKEK